MLLLVSSKREVSSKIDEMIFAPLYSDKRNSRPNAPVNVIVGALILKEFNGLSDDELIEECEFDFRYQYALHTNSFKDQPLSNRTFSRFRERNAAYELVTGRDLIHECTVLAADGAYASEEASSGTNVRAAYTESSAVRS